MITDFFNGLIQSLFELTEFLLSLVLTALGFIQDLFLNLWDAVLFTFCQLAMSAFLGLQNLLVGLVDQLADGLVLFLETVNGIGILPLQYLSVAASTYGVADVYFPVTETVVMVSAYFGVAAGLWLSRFLISLIPTVG